MKLPFPPWNSGLGFCFFNVFRLFLNIAPNKDVWFVIFVIPLFSCLPQRLLEIHGCYKQPFKTNKKQNTIDFKDYSVKSKPFRIVYVVDLFKNNYIILALQRIPKGRSVRMAPPFPKSSCSGTLWFNWWWTPSYSFRTLISTV